MLHRRVSSAHSNRLLSVPRIPTLSLALPAPPPTTTAASSSSARRDARAPARGEMRRRGWGRGRRRRWRRDGGGAAAEGGEPGAAPRAGGGVAAGGAGAGRPSPTSSARSARPPRQDLVRRLERRRDEIAESQRELLEARAMVDEAQRSLWSNIEDSSSGDVLLYQYPFYQANSFSQLIVHLYTIRRDIDNIQLKTGTSAAFGLVKGLAAVEAAKPSELNIDSFISLSVDGAVYLAENIFVFLSAAIALDFCFKFSLLSPFPMRK
uniref:Uncharacterized protein n=1 Tax=Ananas comosus var. bracteatus TaxID=296719 RepID=A0A6V7NSQ4_ANACO|nr:unnamed protein product [Ananas comosus var. bracteatus]